MQQLHTELSDSKQRVDQLQSELSDSKQRVDQLESHLTKLQEDNKTLEAQLQSVQVDYTLSTIVLNSRDWYEIIWLPEISCFKNQPCNRFYPKKHIGKAVMMLYLG